MTEGPLLSVWAHPDDEGYSCGGLMLRALRAGRRVVCITATRGELGFPDDDPRSLEERAAVRTAELKACLSTFGDIEHHWLDYPDGGCADIATSEAVPRIAAIIADVHPSEVLCFGPDGGTNHPDHIATCHWATAALAESGVDAALHYATQTPEWLGRYLEPLNEVNAFMGFTPPSTPRDELSLYAVLDDEELEIKKSAMRCQASQVQPLIDALGESFFHDGLREEFFRRP